MENSLPARKSSPADKTSVELGLNILAWPGCVGRGSLRCRLLVEESGESSRCLLADEPGCLEPGLTVAGVFRGCHRRLTS